MRKILLGLVAATAVAAPLALASSANATVAVENGVGHVDKGDVQTALGWNNKAFDGGAGSLKFTAGAEYVIADYKMSCFNGTTGGIDAEVSHTIIFQTGTTAVTSTPVLNAGNRKQITGFDLTGATSGFIRRRVRPTRSAPCRARRVRSRT